MRHKWALLCQSAKKEFGAIHGVIHAAGIAGGGMLQLKSREAADSVLAPKVEGTLLLESLLSGEPLDFFVLCSSVNAIFGGFGSGAIDYCAANAFQDALSASRAAQGRSPMISINWDAWQEVGMAANMNVPADVQSRARRKFALRNSPRRGH